MSAHHFPWFYNLDDAILGCQWNCGESVYRTEYRCVTIKPIVGDPYEYWITGPHAPQIPEGSMATYSKRSLFWTMHPAKLAVFVGRHPSTHSLAVTGRPTRVCFDIDIPLAAADGGIYPRLWDTSKHPLSSEGPVRRLQRAWNRFASDRLSAYTDYLCNLETLRCIWSPDDWGEYAMMTTGTGQAVKFSAHLTTPDALPDPGCVKDAIDLFIEWCRMVCREENQLTECLAKNLSAEPRPVDPVTSKLVAPRTGKLSLDDFIEDWDRMMSRKEHPWRASARTDSLAEDCAIILVMLELRWIDYIYKNAGFQLRVGRHLDRGTWFEYPHVFDEAIGAYVPARVPKDQFLFATHRLQGVCNVPDYRLRVSVFNRPEELAAPLPVHTVARSLAETPVGTVLMALFSSISAKNSDASHAILRDNSGRCRSNICFLHGHECGHSEQMAKHYVVHTILGMPYVVHEDNPTQALYTCSQDGTAIFITCLSFNAEITHCFTMLDGKPIVRSYLKRKTRG